MLAVGAAIKNGPEAVFDNTGAGGDVFPAIQDNQNVPKASKNAEMQCKVDNSTRTSQTLESNLDSGYDETIY